jgi:hypothetical protein
MVGLFGQCLPTQHWSSRTLLGPSVDPSPDNRPMATATARFQQPEKNLVSRLNFTERVDRSLPTGG